MRKNVSIMFIWLSMLCLVQAKNVSDYFIDMPLNLIPTLESSYRLELIENKLIKGVDTVMNRFGNDVKLVNLDTLNNYLCIRTTENALFEMKVFARGNQKIIGLINTVCAPICSSYVHFYDESWNEITLKLPEISQNLWMKNPNDMVDGTTVRKQIGTSFISFSFDAKRDILLLKNNSLDFLGKVEKKRLEPYFDDKIIEIKIMDL